MKVFSTEKVFKYAIGNIIHFMPCSALEIKSRSFREIHLLYVRAHCGMSFYCRKYTVMKAIS